MSIFDVAEPDWSPEVVDLCDVRIKWNVRAENYSHAKRIFIDKYCFDCIDKGDKEFIKTLFKGILADDWTPENVWNRLSTIFKSAYHEINFEGHHQNNELSYVYSISYKKYHKPIKIYVVWNS